MVFVRYRMNAFLASDVAQLGRSVIPEVLLRAETAVQGLGLEWDPGNWHTCAFPGSWTV